MIPSLDLYAVGQAGSQDMSHFPAIPPVQRANQRPIINAQS